MGEMREDRLEAADKGLVERLSGIGCHMDEALDRVFGDVSFYEELFWEFLEDPAFEELRTGIEHNQAAKAFAAAHTLKGAAATLGLMPAAIPAAHLTELLRGRPSVSPEAEAKSREIFGAMERIRRAAEGEAE